LTYTEALARAATEYGIEPEYVDIWGRTHPTSEEISRSILKHLGVPGGSGEEIEKFLEDRNLAAWTRAVEPTIVVRENADSIRLRIPAGRGGGSVKLEIRWEGGDVEHHWFWLPELQTIETATAGGQEFLAKRVPLPQPLRLGYHDVKMYWMKEPELDTFGEARFIVCPLRAYQLNQRIAGLALSLYGLRSGRNWGCGDFTDLAAVIDQFAKAGAAFIALNPLHAIPNRQPYNTSPYLPQCSFYRNFIYLDVERVGADIGVGSLEIVELLTAFDREFDAASLAPEIESLRAAEFVEYERVAQLKSRVLRILFKGFLDAGQTSAFDQYVEAEGDLLHEFAMFCALDEAIHRDHPDIWLWTDWLPEYREPRSPAVHQFAEEHANDILFYKFLQWHVDRQLAAAQARAIAQGMRIGLYHDLALATDRWGADLWANRSFYIAGCRVGAPPDDFSPLGQDWAFPPPNRDRHRESGYELFAQSIRKNARHGGALRIDHVMRFFRLYWIADGMPTAEGAYVRDYADDLLGILALESVREKFVVIGEDLGTVTEEVRRALAEGGILGYRVLWFEKDPSGRFRAPGEYAAQAAVSTTTHDLPTLAGFLIGRDIEVRKAADLIDEESYQKLLGSRQDEIRRLNDALHDAGFAGDPIGFLLSTPCEVAIVNQEDLTGETEQQNLPGTTWQHPNWRRKMKVAVEDLGPLAENLESAVARSHRK
jgi:4-alpha-glucanotransferase